MIHDMEGISWGWYGVMLFLWQSVNSYILLLFIYF